MDFEWTVKFGDVLTLGGAVFVGATLLYKRGGLDVKTSMTLKTLTDDITEIKDAMKIFATTIARLAVQETKTDMLIKWYDELRRGVGKIE
jgi:hypothetical protein